MPEASRALFEKPLARYGLAVVVVAASFLLRGILVQGLGLEMPTFITFYPAIMLVAVLAGVWPGIFATSLVALGSAYLVLAPIGSFAVARPSDEVALALFALMGVLMSLLAEGYRRSQRSIATYKEERARRQSEEELRKASQEAERERDIQFHTLADSIPQLCWMANADGWIFWYNQRWYDYTGATPEQMEGWGWQSVHDPDLMPKVMERWKNSIATGKSFEMTFPLRGADGVFRVFLTRVIPVEGADGKVERWFGTNTDITEQKTLEQALHLSMEQLEIFVEHAPAALAMFDSGMRYVYASRRWLADYRLGDLDLRGLSYYEVFPEVPERWKEAHRRGLAGEVLREEDDTFIRANGALQRIKWDIRPWHDASGGIGGIVVFTEDITERKRAEEALRKSELHYRSLFGAMDEGFVVIEMIFDPEGKPVDFRYIEVNESYGKQTGLYGVLGKTIREFVPNIESYWLELYAQVALTGEPAHFVNQVKSLNEFFEVNAYRVGEPELHRVAVVCTEISERMRKEEHIRQLSRIYSVLSDINHAIVRMKNPQEMMEAACRIAVDKGGFRMAWIGMIDTATQILEPIASSGEVNGYLEHVRVNLADPNLTHGPAARSIRSGKNALCNDIEHDPLYLPWRDEALRRGYRSSGGFPLKVDGEVVGVFSLYAGEPGFFVEDEFPLLDEMAMDISFALEVNRREEKRAKAEEELRWRTAFFEAQLDSSLDGVLVVNTEGRKILQNQRLNELFKIPEVVSQDTDDMQQVQFVAKLMKNPDQFEEKVKYLYSHPEEVTLDEVELIDGTILERSSAPVRDKALNHYGRIWTFRDITERRHLEEQFRQAQKMEAIGQLTGGIAHDFNNLLTVILGCSEVLGEELQANPRLGKMAEMVQGAAQRGAELTHRMLAFARRQTLQPKSIDINRLLENMKSFLLRTLSADIELDIIPDEGDCKATVDMAQIESALLNLCVNARDAMPNGGKLTIETGNAVLDADYAGLNTGVVPGPYILVAVSDTGCGISPENLGRVFDPFFTTKEVGKGTGLGLSMVYGFVKQSQGHVRIYSEPGHGTSVKLYLPKASQGSEPSVQPLASIVDLRGSEVILLVEDNAPVRELAKSHLVDLGYRVLEAANGKDALKIARERPDTTLLFTDVVMPGGMNGPELALEARRLNPNLKVLYSSGYAESAIRHHGLLESGGELLNKPYTRLELASRIRRVLTES